MSEIEEKIKEDRIRTLEHCIEEQRRDNAFVTNAYKEASTKNITFLAAALGLLGFLYGTSPDSAKTLQDKLFIPHEQYGIIIYCLALALFLGAIGALLLALKPRNWSTAYESGEDEIMTFNDHEHYLKYMKSRYKKIANINTASYVKRQNLVQSSFGPLLIGGILLLLLKTFGG